MFLAYQINPSLNLFKSLSEVILKVSVGETTIEGMVVSRSQLEHARANVDPYVALLRSLGYDATSIDRHLATILYPNRVWFGLAPISNGRPNGGFVVVGNGAAQGVPAVQFSRTPSDVPTSLTAFRSMVSGWYSALGLAPNEYLPDALWSSIWLRYLRGIGLAIQSPNVGTPMVNGSPSLFGNDFFLKGYEPTYIPGFTHTYWQNGTAQGYISTVFSGLYAQGDKTTGMTTGLTNYPGLALTELMGGPTAKTKQLYTTKITAMKEAIWRSHATWGATDEDHPGHSFLGEFTTQNVDSLLGTVITGNSYRNELTLGEELYIIGPAPSLEMVIAFGDSASLIAGGPSTQFSLHTTVLKGVESDAMTRSRFVQVPGLESLSTQLLSSTAGVRFVIRDEPIPLVDVEFESTKLWDYLERGHDLAPDIVDAPETTVYCTTPKITLGMMRDTVIPFLAENYYARHITVVANTIANAAIRAVPNEPVMAAPTNYRVGLMKSTTGLYTSSGGFIKAIDRGTGYYFMSNGVPPSFPEANNVDLDIKYTEAMFLADHEAVSMAEVISALGTIKLEPSSTQEENCQMAVATWVAEDGGFPDILNRLTTNRDEGIRYLHALYALPRKEAFFRVALALGAYTSNWPALSEG